MSKMFDKDIVFHYTKHDKALSILQNNQIWLNPFGCLKDPRESKKWNFDFVGKHTVSCIEEHKYILALFDEYIKETCKVVGFCGWNNDEINFTGNAIPHNRQDYYRAGFSKSRMWSQYAEEHSGVCLAFSRKNIQSQFATTFNENHRYDCDVIYQHYLQDFVKARKVDCDSIIKHGINAVFANQLDKFWKEYFFLKLMDYRDENEYRLVVVDDNQGVALLPIESSLEGIIVGCDIPQQQYDEIIKLRDSLYPNVEMHKLDWQEGRPQLME